MHAQSAVHPTFCSGGGGGRGGGWGRADGRGCQWSAPAAAPLVCGASSLTVEAKEGMIRMGDGIVPNSVGSPAIARPGVPPWVIGSLIGCVASNFPDIRLTTPPAHHRRRPAAALLQVVYGLVNDYTKMHLLDTCLSRVRCGSIPEVIFSTIRSGSSCPGKTLTVSPSDSSEGVESDSRCSAAVVACLFGGVLPKQIAIPLSSGTNRMKASSAAVAAPFASLRDLAHAGKVT
jgi:hypothetical protein